MKEEPLYRQIEELLREEISSGQRKTGERLPSIKQLCAEQKVSKSTVQTAYARLEADGFIEARSRSGYYVTYSEQVVLKTPIPSSPVSTPTFVSAEQILVDIMEKGAAFDVLPHSTNEGHKEQGNEQLRRCLSRAQRRQTGHQQYYYDEPMGLPILRQQLAQRVGYGGGQTNEDEVVITSGCQHALLLALMASTTSGDVVAVESPAFYGFLQLFETLGLQVIELPCAADTGLSPESLRLALQHWKIKALVLSSNFSTPTGAQLPEKNKPLLLEVAEEYGVTIIEDDIYGELQFGLQRPRTLYSYSKSGNVILCSSFSKSLSRDLRLGWILPGKFLKQVKRLKLITALSTSVTLQQGISNFLEEGAYDKHLRTIRQTLQKQCHDLLKLIPELIPNYKSCSQPKGGIALWLELPEGTDTLKLYEKARNKGVIITPGRLFTTQNRYNNFIRLSYLHKWNEERRAALKQLGELV